MHGEGVRLLIHWGLDVYEQAHTVEHANTYLYTACENGHTEVAHVRGCKRRRCRVRAGALAPYSPPAGWLGSL